MSNKSIKVDRVNRGSFVELSMVELARCVGGIGVAATEVRETFDEVLARFKLSAEFPFYTHIYANGKLAAICCGGNPYNPPCAPEFNESECGGRCCFHYI